ncbi:hypothetical protein BH10PSE12_BH10PSE12_02930 [soil metagenome]
MPLAEAIKRRQFNRRYLQVGRALLGALAEIYDIDIETATDWADACDAADEADQHAA